MEAPKKPNLPKVDQNLPFSSNPFLEEGYLKIDRNDKETHLGVVNEAVQDGASSKQQPDGSLVITVNNDTSKQG